MKRILAGFVAMVLCLAACLAAPVAYAQECLSARTTLEGSSSAKISNINIAADKINGIIVPYGASFSFNDIVGPRTDAYGYKSATNGRGVEVTGGGVSQVATTLYLALCKVGGTVSIDEMRTYGSKFQDNYVSDGDQAVITDYSAETDFAFTNYTDDMYIEMWTTESYLYCTITLDGETDPSLEWNAEPAVGMLAPTVSASIAISDDPALRTNIMLAADSINDTVFLPGDLFSFNGIVGPRTEKCGYVSAINGRGVEVVGGGVAQVASVVWLAIKNDPGVAIVEKSTYGSKYNQDYVYSSNDAILTDYTADTDFSFRNSASTTMTISTYVSDDILFCDIYRD